MEGKVDPAADADAERRGPVAASTLWRPRSASDSTTTSVLLVPLLVVAHILSLQHCTTMSDKPDPDAIVPLQQWLKLLAEQGVPMRTAMQFAAKA